MIISCVPRSGKLGLSGCEIATLPEAHGLEEPDVFPVAPDPIQPESTKANETDRMIKINGFFQESFDET